MLQRYKKNRTSASFLLTKCATFLIKCYWGTFSVPSHFWDSFLFRGERESRAPTSLRSPTSNAHTLPRASCATQNEEVAEQLFFCFVPYCVLKQVWSTIVHKTKRALSDSFFILCCGERGIRTPGTSQFNGFQDRRNRPLCHLSFVSTNLHY